MCSAKTACCALFVHAGSFEGRGVRMLGPSGGAGVVVAALMGGGGGGTELLAGSAVT